MIQRFADAIYAQQLAMLGLLLSWISLAGCSELLPVLVPYGSVSSPDQYRSINGLGIHRRMWESTGAKVLTPSKLSPKLESVDVIVLVGQTYNPPGKTARRWLEDWLAAGNGRTVIYFGRDFNADVYYREQTLAQVPIEEQPRAEQLRALAVASDLGERIREIPESTFCDWFFIDVDQTTQYFKKFGGDWGEEVDGLSGSWPTRALLQPPLPSFQTRTPSWLAAQPGKATTPSPESPIGNSGIRRSIWKPTEFDNQQAWDEAFQALPHIDNLLASSDGQPLVFRFSDPIKFPRSQIIIVTNGAPLLNGSLTEPLHQRIGELLIEEALPAERVALLAFDTNGLLISDVPEADPRGAGLEMLLLWPLSGITMPAALLGIIVCVALLPILGRPQSSPRRSVSDFGLHIEALGMMLQETRDLEYAKSAIADYFRKVRGESPPVWLEEPPSSSNANETSASQLLPKSLASPTNRLTGSTHAEPTVPPPPAVPPAND